MGRLSGKVAIITGAASGMGAKECELFAKEGACVVATDIQEELLNEVVEAINAAGGQAIAFKHDVTSEEQWKEVVALTVEKFGKVDILVNNAGVSCTSVIANIEMSEWNRVMDINLNSCVLGMKYAVPEMQKNGSGSVVNISSIGGLVGMAGSSPYTASKGALRVLSKAAAIEYGKDKVRVNSVHPGIIVTPMTEPHMGPAMPYYEAHILNFLIWVTQKMLRTVYYS